MDDPWKTKPMHLEDRVRGYIERASTTGLASDLTRRYGLILIAASEVVAYREQGIQETRDEVARIAAGEHGIFVADPDKARKLYAEARRVQQQVHASAKSCSGRLTRLSKLLETGYDSLPLDVQSQFPQAQLDAAFAILHGFAIASAPNPTNLAQVKFEKSEFSLTPAGHTLLWWRTYVPKYRNKWNDLYRLALCWRLTEAKDISDFRRGVLKLRRRPDSRGVTYLLGCPPWALE